MIKIPYDIFYMSCMLKDKLLATKLEQLSKRKVERMDSLPAGPFTNLYKLSHKQTHIIDSIYLGNAYNACNVTDLEGDNIGMIVNITEEIQDQALASKSSIFHIWKTDPRKNLFQMKLKASPLPRKVNNLL